MAPKRKAAATSSKAAAEPPKKRASAAKAPVKVVKVEKPKAKKQLVNPEEFVAKLLECCKVLMTVCETMVLEDPKALTVTTEENFATHGDPILKLMPEEARLPMMKIALMYQEELDADPPFLWEELDDEEEEPEPVKKGKNAKGKAASGKAAAKMEPEVEEDDEDDDIMRPEHFYHFKKLFTQAEAAKFLSKANDAMEKALDSMVAEDAEDAGDGEEGEEDEDTASDDDDDEDEDWTDANVKWKDE